ncbi:MAG: alpha/beta hydrolase [Planctomycetes bacterium]|jgi:hypothetical protein|nr:alpha/beta hydrolase [Planctomycetota bacterium]
MTTTSSTVPSPVTPDPLPTAATPSHRGLGLALLLVLVGAFVAAVVQTDGGAVQVTGLRIPMQGGQWLAADLFRPRTATKEQKAPLVVVVPGFQRSKEALSNVPIELARRGIVALSIDPYAQGNSSSSNSSRAATEEGYGLFGVIDLVAKVGLLDYVDTERIGATGHSAGGNAVILAASHFGKRARKEGGPSLLHSAYVSGYLLSFTDKVLKDVRSNCGASYALYDEGAFRNERGDGDMRTAPEALRFVAAGRDKDEPPLQQVEIGRWYGDAAQRRLRIVHNEPLLHPLQPYSTEATANQIAFFERTFGLEGARPPHDQVWWWKEFATLLCLCAAFLGIVPFTALLLASVRWFRPLVHAIPPAAPVTMRGTWFWVLLVAGAAIACVSYIPMTELSQQWFESATRREQTLFFPQRMNNGLMLWALLNGLVGFVLFGLGRRLAGGRGPVPALQTNVGQLLRAAALSACVFTFFFGLLFAVHWLFHVDFRFTFFGARAFDASLLPLLALYAPAFLPFFVGNSLRTNCGMRFAGEAEWRSRLRAMGANSLGLLLILVVQYTHFAATGRVYWTDGWLYVNLLFAVVPMMFVLPWFHRRLFELTGRIHVGPLVMCPIFIMMLVANTVCYLPF